MAILNSLARKRPSSLALIAVTILSATAMCTAVLAPSAMSQQPAAQMVSKQMAAPMNEARTAAVAKDWATAKAKLDVAATFAKTPQDMLALEQLRYVVADGLGDAQGKVKSIEAVIATNLLTGDELKKYKGGLAQAYLLAGDEKKAVALTRAYVDEYGGTHAQYIGIANDALKANDAATAVVYSSKAIESARSGGAKAPESYYRIQLKAFAQTKELDKYYTTIETLIVEYPKDEYWKELITGAQREPGYQAAASDVRLDVYRTMAAAGVKLTPDEKANMASEALKRVLPAETVAILQPLYASGEIGGAADTNAVRHKAIFDEATKKAEVEKAGLAQEEKEVTAKGDAGSLAALGEVYMAYGDNAKAADLIQKGLAKGITDAGKADMAKLHLGMAQHRSGQKDAARTTWAEIKADNGAAMLARTWTLISKTQP
jgi:hypothetical protein